MSLQLWLFTLIKSELWGISLSPISVFLFPPCSQLPPFLPSFLSPARPHFSLLPFFSDLLSLMTETKLLDVCRPSLTEAHSLISLFLPLSHHISLCPARPFSPSSYSALRLKEERIEASGVKDRPPSCTELQCRFLSTQDRKRTLVSPAWLDYLYFSVQRAPLAFVV